MTSPRQAASQLLKLAKPAASLPILAHVSVTPGSIAGTDLRTYARFRVPEFQPVDGTEVLLPAVALSALLATLEVTPAPDYIFSHKDRRLIISQIGERSTAKVMYGKVEGFPREPEVGGPVIEVETQDLLAAIARVSKMASKNDDRPTLNAVHLKATGDRLNIEAADGFRLGRTHIPAEPAGDLETVIPLDSALFLVGLGKLVGGKVSIQADKTVARFDFGDVLVCCQRVEGVYPDLEELFPKTAAAESVTVEPGNILPALKRALIFEGVCTTLSFEKGDEIKVESEAQGVGGHSETVPATVRAEPGTLSSLRAQWAIEMLETYAGQVNIDFRGIDQPVIFSGADDVTDYIVMPIVLHGNAR